MHPTGMNARRFLLVFFLAHLQRLLPPIEASITGVLPVNGPTSGQQVLLVAGAGFGSSDPTATIYLVDSMLTFSSRVNCATTTWTSDTSNTCVSSPNAGQAMDVGVSLGVTLSYAAKLYTFDAPILTLLSRQSVSYGALTLVPNFAASGGTWITLLGLNMGSSDFSPTVSYGRRLVCGTSTWSTTTKILCSPVGYGSATGTALTVAAVVGTSATDLTFDAPYATWPSALNLPLSSNVFVTVEGLSFGAVDLTASMQLSLTPSATTAWTSTTTVKCAIANIPPQAPYMVVTVAMVVGSNTQRVSFDAAVLSMARPFNSVSSTYTAITVPGLSFGSSEYTATVWLRATPASSTCDTASWSSTTSIMCTELAAVGTAQLFTTIANTVGTSIWIFTFDAPTASFLPLPNVAVSGGSSVTVAGLSFGADAGTATVQLIAGTICSCVSWTTSSSVVCASPRGVGADRAVIVTVGSVAGTGVGMVTFDAPVGSHLVVPNVVASGNPEITIIGQGFGTTDATATAAVDARSCTAVSWTTSTRALCTLSPQGGYALSFIFTVAAVAATQYRAFSYDAPVPTAVAANAVVTGAFSLTITGLSFGAVMPTATAAMEQVGCITSSWCAFPPLPALIP